MPKKPPFPVTPQRFAYFLAAAIGAAIVGGYLYRWLDSSDPLGPGN